MEIDEMAEIVAKWAASQPMVTRAYLYGSRVHGTLQDDSDLDIAIEIQPLPGDSSAFATWISEASALRRSLAPLLPMSADLEWYGGADATPTIERGLVAGSRLVYERAA